MTNSKKLLASLAVFGVMHQNKKDTNQILLEFLISIIKERALYQFDIAIINNFLQNDYEFDIPDAVITNVLKKSKKFNIENHQFRLIDENILSEFNLKQKENTQSKINNKFIYDLNRYIENKLERKLTGNDRREIIKTFMDFMLDKAQCNSSDFFIYISSYILSRQDDKSFIDTLQTIKEAVILYLGLQYNFDTSTWKKNLTIYLNVEILFHATGYDGEVQKLLFDDFVNIIRDVNKKDKKISLKYLEQTNEEINYFFDTAEKIIKKEIPLKRYDNVMATIVNGCSDVLDIIHKKSIFLDELKTYNIELEDEDNHLYDLENNQFNIFSLDLLKKYTTGENEFVIQKYLNILNTINIKRAGNEYKELENSKFILLSDNNKLRAISKDSDIKTIEKAPLLYSLHYVTIYIWYKINKGFSQNYPSSFKVVTKAQITLTSIAKDSLSSQYQKLENKTDLTDDVGIAILSELKEKTNIANKLHSDDDDIDSMLETIKFKEEDIEKYHRNHSTIKKKAESVKNENLLLEEKLSKSHSEVQSITADNYKIRVNALKSKKELLKIKEIEKNRLLNEGSKKFIWYKGKLIILNIIIFALFIGIVILFDWNNTEPIAWLLTVPAYGFLYFSYLLIFEREFNPMKMLENRKNSIMENLVTKHEFDYNSIEKLKDEINDLENIISKKN